MPTVPFCISIRGGSFKTNSALRRVARGVGTRYGLQHLLLIYNLRSLPPLARCLHAPRPPPPLATPSQPASQLPAAPRLSRRAAALGSAAARSRSLASPRSALLCSALPCCCACSSHASRYSFLTPRHACWLPPRDAAGLSELAPLLAPALHLSSAPAPPPALKLLLPPESRRMKKLARAKAKDRQATSSATGSIQDHDSHDDDSSTHESAPMRTCGPHNVNPHLVHYSDRSELRRICVVCSKRQHFYCPSCNSFMCLGPCFVKHHSS